MGYIHAPLHRFKREVPPLTQPRNHPGLHLGEGIAERLLLEEIEAAPPGMTRIQVLREVAKLSHEIPVKEGSR